MCDNCKIEETQEEKQLELTGEELMQLMQQTEPQELTYFREPLEFEDEELEEIEHLKEFIDGKSDATYWVGYWNTLLNCGVPEQLAIELVLTEQQNKANVVIQKMNVEMNKEMSKNQSLAVDKNQF